MCCHEIFPIVCVFQSADYTLKKSDRADFSCFRAVLGAYGFGFCDFNKPIIPY